MKKNVWQIPKPSPYLQESLVLDSGHLLVPGSEKKWYSMEENSQQGIWDHIRGQDAVGVRCEADALFSVQRLHCPGVKLKSKGHGNLSIHFTADYPTIETFA